MRSIKNQNPAVRTLLAKSLLLTAFLFTTGAAGSGTPAALRAGLVPPGTPGIPTTAPTGSSASDAPIVQNRPANPSSAGNLIGIWMASVRYDGQSLVWVYSFNGDGTFEDAVFDGQGRVVSNGRGKYTFGDRGVVIYFSGGEERASLDWINADEFKYKITSHSDAKQVGLVAGFRRYVPPASHAAPPSQQQQPARSIDGRPPVLATGGSYRGEYFQFNYPPKWHVLYDGEDPQSPGFALVSVFSPDNSEFAEVRYRLPNRQAAARDFLSDIMEAYSRQKGIKGGWWLDVKFREVFAGRGVDSLIRRMIMEDQPEFFGTTITAPGRTPVAENYAHVIYKRDTDAPRPTDMMSTPGGMKDDELPRYAGAIAGRQLILSSFQFRHAGARNQPTITGRWDGTNGSGVALDMNEDGTFVSLWHTAPGSYSLRAAGRYEVTSSGVILRYTTPSVRTQTCSDFRLFHDELSGADILVLCGSRYRQ